MGRILLHDPDPCLLVTPEDVDPPHSIEELSTLTWLSVDDRAAAHSATRDLITKFSNVRLSPNTYDVHDVAVAMIAAGLSVALIPRIAMARLMRDDIRVVSLPDRGARRLIARFRTQRGGPAPEISIALDELASLVTEHAIDR